MPNRLAAATSPYLLQHADNPVDWWEWSPEALELARRQDRPILLSVGYAACHWCHVMAHESFEDETTAAFMNDHFVPIKVDREERPDLDAVYMQATQAMTGQGGWPMTVFPHPPDGSPFYAGTYFPPVPTHGLPAFRQVLEAVAEAWQQRRDEVATSARTIWEQLSAVTSSQLAGEASTIDVASAIVQLATEFDPTHGGFGQAPKFPPSMIIEALLRDGGEDATAMALRTLDAMAAGGIYDQLAGGFSRYSVDAHWTVPHFEKMLYDNALLLGCYTHAWRRTQNPRHAEVVSQTVGWLLSEMRTGDGAFAASLDADSIDPDEADRPDAHAVEGAYYVWTPDQLLSVLGERDGAWAAEVFGVSADGTFEHGRSTLTRRRDVEDPERLARVSAALRTARDLRPRPGRDDKVVAAWNGWLIASLVEAGMVFDRPDWVDAASRAAEAIWRVHWRDGRLRRTSRDGSAGSSAGVLDDYAAVLLAFVRVAEATGAPEWVQRAEQLAEVIEGGFDAGDGGYFDTAADAEALVSRPREPADNATPSGLSSTVHAFTRLSGWTGDERWARRAEQAADSVAELVRRAPRFAGWLLAAAIDRDQPPVQVAVVGPADDPNTSQLTATAWRAAPSGSVIVTGPPNAPDVPLLADRTMIDNRPTGYVCRHFVCRLPVTDPAALIDQLTAQA